MNKNSNTYIIAYATILVVVVAAVLAYASISLSGRQQANVLIEKKGAILASIGRGLPDGDIPGGKDAYVNAEYDKYITASFFIDAQGVRTDATAGEVLGTLSKLPEVFEARTALPVFEARVGDAAAAGLGDSSAAGSDVIYVVPMTGKGLWGPVWGYVALNGDCTTIVGAVFDHKGETPGLGAEISLPPFHKQFVGKHLFEDGEFKSVTLTKGVGSSTGNPFAVDAISGGTLTSNGVRDMLWDCLEAYVPFFLKVQSESLLHTPSTSGVADSLAVADSVVVVEGAVEVAGGKNVNKSTVTGVK